MAIFSVAPSIHSRVISRPTQEPSTKGDLKLISTPKVVARVDRKSFASFLSVVAVLGLLSLLAINTMLSQGAFELSKLQAEAITLNDQRDALMKKIDRASSPEVLAYRAKFAGMVSSQNPRFLVVDSLEVLPIATEQASVKK